MKEMDEKVKVMRLQKEAKRLPSVILNSLACHPESERRMTSQGAASSLLIDIVSRMYRLSMTSG